MAEITLDLEHLPGYLDDIAQEQVPFALAKTMTQLAIMVADDAVDEAKKKFNITQPFYLSSATHARIGQGPSPARAIHAIPANKHTYPDLHAYAGVTHWGIAELMGEHQTVRGTKTAKYRWIPLKGRKLGYGVKQAYPGQGSKSKGNFFMKTKSGKHLLVTRAGKSRKITPMFMRVKTQDIIPIYDLQKEALNTAKVLGQWMFEHNMDDAIKTAKPRKED